MVASGREPLIELLQRYRELVPADAALAGRFLDFVAAHPRCLWRDHFPGHITASAWIVDATGSAALLTHHRKLDRWLQLGGHVDGEARVERAAWREAVEESGMAEFACLGPAPGCLLPLDLDVHTIPARGSEPQHEHWDLRFLLQAAAGQSLQLSVESKALRWLSPGELLACTSEESVLRLQRRAAQWRQTSGWHRVELPN